MTGSIYFAKAIMMQAARPVKMEKPSLTYFGYGLKLKMNVLQGLRCASRTRDLATQWGKPFKQQLTKYRARQSDNGRPELQKAVFPSFCISGRFWLMATVKALMNLLLTSLVWTAKIVLREPKGIITSPSRLWRNHWQPDGPGVSRNEGRSSDSALVYSPPRIVEGASFYFALPLKRPARCSNRARTRAGTKDGFMPNTSILQSNNANQADEPDDWIPVQDYQALASQFQQSETQAGRFQESRPLLENTAKVLGVRL